PERASRARTPRSPWCSARPPGAGPPPAAQVPQRAALDRLATRRLLRPRWPGRLPRRRRRRWRRPQPLPARPRPAGDAGADRCHAPPRPLPAARPRDRRCLGSLALHRARG
ncbi:unnamed protein product, partial [Prorocentrum cordatum]